MKTELALQMIFLSFVNCHLEVKCRSDLLQLVGEEVTECVNKQQEVAKEAEKVFRGKIYRQV